METKKQNRTFKDTIVKKPNKQNTIFILIFICFSAFLIWKAHYGYIFNDEPFMVTLGHRLLKGDHFLVNEWNLTQFTGVFFVPVIYIYTTIKGTNEGLILFCRIIYVVWWLFVGAILYNRLKKYGWISIISVSMFLLYTPLDEMTLTYNAMSLSLLILFVSYFLTKGNLLLDYLNGIILAFSILAYPTLISIYIVYFIAVFIKNTFKINTNPQTNRMLSWQLFIRTTFSAALIAIVFIVFLLSGGINEIIESLKQILLFRAQNNASALNLIKLLVNSFPLQSTFGFLFLVISIFDKRRNNHAVFYFYIQAAIYIISIPIVLLNIYQFNIIMIPLAFVGIQSFILTKKKDCSALISFIIIGIIFAFCAYTTSDTGMLAFSNGFVILDIVGIIFIYQFYQERIEEINKLSIKKALVICLSCVLMFQIGSELSIKLVRTYWDSLFPNLNTEIQSGVAKGIKTTKKHADHYNEIYTDIVEIQKLTQKNQELNFFSPSLFPSIYLDLNYNYGTFSSWTHTGDTLDFNILNNKLSIYYKINPEKKADVIYIHNNDINYIDNLSCINFNQYEKINLKTGQLFIRLEK